MFSLRGLSNLILVAGVHHGASRRIQGDSHIIRVQIRDFAACRVGALRVRYAHCRLWPRRRCRVSSSDGGRTFWSLRLLLGIDENLRSLRCESWTSTCFRPTVCLASRRPKKKIFRAFFAKLNTLFSSASTGLTLVMLNISGASTA